MNVPLTNPKNRSAAQARKLGSPGVTIEAGFLSIACADACEPPAIMVDRAWIGSEGSDRRFMAVYGDITNYCHEPVELVRVVSSELIGAAAYYVKKAPVRAAMVPLTGIEIQPRSRFRLFPKSRFVMLINSNRSFFIGSELDLLFEFSTGKSFKTTAKVNMAPARFTRCGSA